MIRLYVSEIPKPGQTDVVTGISVYTIDAEKEKLQFLESYPLQTITNVSCMDKKRKLLYVTAEEPNLKKQRCSGDRIFVLRIHEETGLIQEVVDKQPTLSPNPVYVTQSPDGNYLLVANHATHNAVLKVRLTGNGQWHTHAEYDDSTVILYSLNKDGTTNQIEDVAIQEGSGPLRTQTHAHPHSVVFSSRGDVLAVPDKGADKVFFYQLDSTAGKLNAVGLPYSSLPGDEPRFCVFHPTKPFLYVNHEGNLGLDVLQQDETGNFQQIQTVCAEPEGTVRQHGRIYEHQGLAIHPSGKWLYSVARGIDAMVVYAIDPATGQLNRMQTEPIPGKWPRCCQITPDGHWLVAGTRDSGELLLYRIEANGLLTLVDKIAHICGVAYVTTLEI